MKLGSITVLPGAPDSFSLEISDGQTVYIGRKSKRIRGNPENYIILPFPEVSAKHAEIRCEGNVWVIIDAGSTNGTTVNGVRLNPGKEYTLKNNDVVGIAQYDLLVCLPSGESNKESNIWHGGGKDPETEQDKTKFQVKLITATILVADLKHFTSLMERSSTDPSVVMQSANKIFARLNREIEHNHGQLEKIAGDAIMAYWSSKDSQTEAKTYAHRACTTALRLQEITHDLAVNNEIWPFPGHPLVFDIALCSGQVASGALGKSQGNPALLGDTANLAFRLEKLIPDQESGQIVVDLNTYELVKEQFDFRFLGEYAIKGRHNFVNVYQLLGAITR